MLQAEGRTGELTLTFVDRDEIAALNAEHMGEHGPTDVLSFPLDSIDDSTAAMPGPVLLGDVVVCPAVASEAAPTHAGTLDDELALLVVHGILHVLGHDHAEPQRDARDARARAGAARAAPLARPGAGSVHAGAGVVTGSELALLLTIVLMLLLLMVLAAAETALNRISRVKAQALADANNQSRSARALVRLVEHPERFINPLLVTDHGAAERPDVARRPSRRPLGHGRCSVRSASSPSTSWSSSSSPSRCPRRGRSCTPSGRRW